jgi:hypothetical protein
MRTFLRPGSIADVARIEWTQVPIASALTPVTLASLVPTLRYQSGTEMRSSGLGAL